MLAELWRRPEGCAGLVILTMLVILSLFPQVIAPHSPDQVAPSQRLEGPSRDHLLGTDQLGRDLLSRVIYGTRIALGVSIPAIGLALVLGLVLGLTAGYAARRLDDAFVVVMDALQSFPAVILALALIAVLGPSIRNVVLVITVAFIPSYARVTRALVLATRQNQWVTAEEALGASRRRVMWTHLLPNIVPSILVLLAMDIPTAITIEAGLSFLGLGVQPPTPSWGVILADGATYINQSPWGVIAAGGALIVATVGFTMLGEAMRDVIDPRAVRLRKVTRP